MDRNDGKLLSESLLWLSRLYCGTLTSFSFLKVDGKRTAQFEHTLLISEDGVEALTGKKGSSPVQFWERESKVHQGIWLGTTPAAKRRMEEINALPA